MSTLANDRHVVGRWISARASLSPGRVAIEFGEVVITYRELEDRSTSLARALAGSGLSPGSRVATLAENHPEQVVLFFACAKAGLILAPLNWRLTTDELAVQLDLFDPSLLVVSSVQWRRFSESPVIASRMPKHLDTLTADLEGVADDVRLPTVCDDDGLLLIATSGTTGRPKGALLTHANCFWTNLGLDLSMPIDQNDVVLQVLPQYHVGGWNVQPLLAWWTGATVVLEPTFEPARVLELIARRRITTMMGVPTTYLMLANEPNFEDTDLTSLRTVIVGGAAMPVSLAERWRSRGVAVAQGYGLTEASPNVCYLAPDAAADHPGSVGRPYAYVELALYDVDGSVIEGGGRGELWVSGPNVFAGYWQNPLATAAVLHEGWLNTGDIADRDDDGFYWISGRSKEMFVSGGENVYPVEVERVLTMFDDVAEAAVVGVSHPKWGEVGVAFVVPCRGARVDVAVLMAHCRAHLASFKIPQSVQVVDELPKTHIGKVDKLVLKSRARESD